MSGSSIFMKYLSLLFFVAQAQSLSFNFTSFNGDNSNNIICHNDSTVENGVIKLTKNGIDQNLNGNVGRASYSRPGQLWSKKDNKTSSFTTHFSFNITQLGNDPKFYRFGDGIAFFLTSFDDSTAHPPAYSGGGCLGLIGGHNNSCKVTSKYPFVAVEFDTFNNDGWDPYVAPSLTHLGIDVTSVTSKVYSRWMVENDTTANVWITYDSPTQNLSVYLTYDVNPVFNGESNLSHIIDLSSVLPETVRVGFSSTTGANLELHYILSWDFNSTLEDDVDISVPIPMVQQNHTLISPPPPTEGKSKGALVGVLVAGISVVTIVLGTLGFMWWRRRSAGATSNEMSFDVNDEDFDQETGPKRFTYNQLSSATNNFFEEGKLGEGGFGGVYRGFLADLSKEIAVKKISRGSKQGIKEYMSEVKIISRLRHKNLVQLLGWCHEKGDLLLVYEFMPNGSLDSHVYRHNQKAVLPWSERYKIAQGLASALLYLHEEWDQCVLHRDIKSSNVMLDFNFNAKLGDFGLARLVDHNLGSQTTALAGTLGYLAPECVMTGKSSKESDVYSFGVVALEVACGRRAVESNEEPSKVSLVEWVWNLYGKGSVLEAVDERLEGKYDTQQIECLMIVGLWCSHPDHTNRPSIRHAINVLNGESPLPKLPMKFPVPIYYSTPTNMEAFYITSSSYGITGSSTGTTGSSSQSAASGSAPLLHSN